MSPYSGNSLEGLLGGSVLGSSHSQYQDWLREKDLCELQSALARSQYKWLQPLWTEDDLRAMTCDIARDEDDFISLKQQEEVKLHQSLFEEAL